MPTPADPLDGLSASANRLYAARTLNALVFTLALTTAGASTAKLSLTDEGPLPQALALCASALVMRRCWEKRKPLVDLAEKAKSDTLLPFRDEYNAVSHVSVSGGLAVMAGLASLDPTLQGLIFSAAAGGAVALAVPMVHHNKAIKYNL